MSLIRKQHHFNFWPHAETTILILVFYGFLSFVRFTLVLFFGCEWLRWICNLDALRFLENSREMLEQKLKIEIFNDELYDSQ